MGGAGRDPLRRPLHRRHDPPLLRRAGLRCVGGAGASAMIIAASLAFLRSGVIRPWAGWLGVAAGILALASIAFFPQAAIALWILVVSGLLFARSARDVPTHTGAVAP